MYWFFDFSYVGLLDWILSLAMVAIGGWLLASRLFDLEDRERFLVGPGLGLAIYLWLCNLIGRWSLPLATYLGCAVLVLAFGLASGIRSSKQLSWFGPWTSLLALVLPGVILFWMFFRISKGTAMFDEYKHLALVSTLANGQIPPILYFGSAAPFFYHYGFHLFAAAMMQLGHFMPWSALDLSKAAIWSYSILLAGLIGRRLLGTRLGAILIAAVMTLASGTRYLLLLLPANVLSVVNKGFAAANPSSSGTFADLLQSHWTIAGGPPLPYPFAFLNDVNPPYIVAHAGSYTIKLFVLALGILLAGRAARRASVAVYAVFFSYWALASEASYALFGAGLALFGAWQWIHGTRPRDWDLQLRYLLIGFLISVPVALLQGGTITGLLYQSALAQATPQVVGAPVSPGGFLGFRLQWPPGVATGELGTLSLFSPGQLLIALAETGPIPFFLPWLTRRFVQHPPEPNWLLSSLTFAAWLGTIFPLFVGWRSANDIIHITSFGLQASAFLLALYTAELFAAGGTGLLAKLGGISLGLACVTGLVLGGVQLTAMPNTILSDNIHDSEALLLPQLWGKLSPASKILALPGNASILTGQVSPGFLNFPSGPERAIWQQLATRPTLSLLVANRFDFVYADQRWWSTLGASSQRELESPCISVLARAQEPGGTGFAELLDLRGCH